MSLDGVLGSLETQTNILIPSPAALANAVRLGRLGAALVVEEDVRLLLESALALDRQLCRHDCGVVAGRGGVEADVRCSLSCGRVPCKNLVGGCQDSV